jgi:energy-coupling factor transporter ATP-binding protein EcfA2
MSTSRTVPTIELAAHAIEVTKSYGTGPAVVTALDRVSVAFGRGRFSAVMGPSGSGKSTLLHCLAGLDAFDHGEIQLAGVDLSGLDERRRAHREPRLAVERGAAGVPAPLGRRAGPDRGDGHPRPGRCRPRRRGGVPCRWPHRRPDGRSDAERVLDRMKALGG